MNLYLWTKLNGHYEQQGNINDMLFHIHEMLSYFSHHMRLLPGDILATGTPPGVGMGKINTWLSGTSWSAALHISDLNDTRLSLSSKD